MSDPINYVALGTCEDCGAEVGLRLTAKKKLITYFCNGSHDPKGLMCNAHHTCGAGHSRKLVSQLEGTTDAQDLETNEKRAA